MNPYYKLAFQVLNKENAGLAFNKRTKWPLWVPGFNLWLSLETCDTWYLLLLAEAQRSRGGEEGVKATLPRTSKPCC